MKKAILYLCIIPIIIGACEKEKSDRILLKKVSSRGVNDYTYLYSYDNQKRLISVESISPFTGAPLGRSELTYKNGKLFTMDFVLASYLEFTYYEDSIYVYRCYETSADRYLNYIFYYNHNVIDSINFRGRRYRFILDAHDNLLGTSICEPDMICRFNTTYDDMKNAYSSLPIEYRIIYNMDIGENNITRYDNYYYSYSMKYTYNDDNYPTECIIEDADIESEYSYDTLFFEYE
jgi:hypothetical protein